MAKDMDFYIIAIILKSMLKITFSVIRFFSVFLKNFSFSQKFSIKFYIFRL